MGKKKITDINKSLRIILAQIQANKDAIFLLKELCGDNGHSVDVDRLLLTF